MLLLLYIRTYKRESGYTIRLISDKKRALPMKKKMVAG